MSVFRKNNKIYIVHKSTLEPYEHFIERGNFIAAQEPTKEEYENVLLYSRMYINNKHLGLEYQPAIMKKLGQMIANC